MEKGGRGENVAVKLDNIYRERGSWERSNPLKIISSRIIREHLYEAESVVDVENKIRLVNAQCYSKSVRLERRNSIYFS